MCRVSIVKDCLVLDTRFHQSCFLQASCIPDICDALPQQALLICQRIFQVGSSCRDLCLEEDTLLFAMPLPRQTLIEMQIL